MESFKWGIDNGELITVSGFVPSGLWCNSCAFLL